MANLFSFGGKEEVQALQKEGAKALRIDQAGSQHGPIELQEEDNYVMLVGEERIRLQPRALEDPPVKNLIGSLIKWMNDILEARRIIIRDIIEDLYDGQTISEFIELLTGQRFMSSGITQSAVLQKAKLKIVLDKIDKLLQMHPDDPDRRWSIDAIHSKDAVAILHLMVALASYFRCKHPIPVNVKIRRIYLKQLENKLETKLFEEEITGRDYGPRAPEQAAEKDVFDKLFSEAPEKLEAVKRSLCQFASKVLNELSIPVTDLQNQFHNGVNLVLMMGLLEGYFVPLYHFKPTPMTVDDKITNVRLAFKLMEETGLPQAKIDPFDVVQRDLKSTLRVLYALFQKYKARVQSGVVGPQRPTSTVSMQSVNVH